MAVSRNRLGAALCFLAFGAYILIGRGTFATSDEGGIFNTALSLAWGSLAIGPGENVFEGADGRFYSVKEILPSIVTVPFVWTGAALERLGVSGRPPIAPGPARVGLPGLATANWPIFLSLFLGPICIALTLVQLYRFVRLDGGSEGPALALAAVAAVATPLVVYAKTISRRSSSRCF